MASEEKVRQRLVDKVRKADDAVLTAIKQDKPGKVQSAFADLNATIGAVLDHHNVKNIGDIENNHSKTVCIDNVVNSLASAIGHDDVAPDRDYTDIALNSAVFKKLFAVGKDMDAVGGAARRMLVATVGGVITPSDLYKKTEKFDALMKNPDFINMLERLDKNTIHSVAEFVNDVSPYKTANSPVYGLAKDQERYIVRTILENNTIRGTLAEWSQSERLQNDSNRSHYDKKKIGKILKDFEQSQQKQLPGHAALVDKTGKLSRE